MNIEVLLEYARALDAQGVVHDALVQLHKVVELDPDHREARSRLAGIYGRMGDWPHALRQWATLVEQHPGDAELRLESAEALFETNQPAEAAASVAEALRLGRAEPEVLLRCRRWLTRLPQECAEGRTRLAEGILQVVPGDESALELLAHVAESRGDRATAGSLWARLLESNPEHPTATARIGALAYERAKADPNESPNAEALLRRAGRPGTRVDAVDVMSSRLLLADLRVSRGDLGPETCELLQSVEAQGLPSEMRGCFRNLLRIMGSRLLEGGEPRNGHPWLQRARQLGDTESGRLLEQSFIRIARDLDSQRRRDEARSTCEEGFRLLPESSALREMAEQFDRRERSSRLALVLGLTALLSVLAIGAWLWRARTTPARDPAPSAGAPRSLSGRWMRIDSDGDALVWVLDQRDSTLSGLIEQPPPSRYRELLEGQIAADGHVQLTSTVHDGSDTFNNGYFSGDLSAGGDTIDGTFEITAHNLGRWTLSRMRSTQRDVESETARSARFQVQPCGSIMDHRTGYEWFVGPDRTLTWKEAHEWAGALANCGGEWRLPSSDEVLGIYEPGSSAGTGYQSGGRSWPAHLDPAFSKIGGGSWVWTGREPAAGIGTSINLNQGSAAPMQADSPGFPVRALAVRPVHGS